MTDSKSERGLAWQVGVWDRMADPYVREVDSRFEPVIEHLLLRASLQVGENVLDLGTGTGAAALIASKVDDGNEHDEPEVPAEEQPHEDGHEHKPSY